MRCCSGNSTHTCNQWKFNTCKAKASCMSTNPKTKTWPAMHSPSSTSSLLWLSQATRTSKKLFTSLFPTGPCKSEIFISTLRSFLLRKELGSSLKSLLSNPQVHTLKESKAHLISSFYSFKTTRIVKNTLPCIPMGPTPKRKKTLSSSLPLILLGPATRKGKSFHAREIPFLFSPHEP